MLDIRPKARADILRLAEDDPTLADRIVVLLRQLENGTLTGEPLTEMPRYGFLADCCKVYFGAPRKAPNTHRIV